MSNCEIEIIKINTDFITLGQFLKFTGQISTGGNTKMFIEENEILVENEIEKRRGKKLYSGMKIKLLNKCYEISRV